MVVKQTTLQSSTLLR